MNSRGETPAEQERREAKTGRPLSHEDLSELLVAAVQTIAALADRVKALEDAQPRPLTQRDVAQAAEEAARLSNVQKPRAKLQPPKWVEDDEEAA